MDWKKIKHIRLEYVQYILTERLALRQTQLPLPRLNFTLRVVGLFRKSGLNRSKS